jgi:predicted amidohydrolase
MIVAALSLAGLDLSATDKYASGLRELLLKCNPAAAVLPAHSALTLGLETGVLKQGDSLFDAIKCYLHQGTEWNREYLKLHSQLASGLNLYLAAGTVMEKDNGHFYHTAYCFDPTGNICCKQHQTHLSCLERELGLSRGEELSLFQLDGFPAALVVGNDARHPEVGRIMTLLGADLLLHSGALEGSISCWPQAAGMWAQVQQNQIWAVEAQFSGVIADISFGASLAVLAPCEITAGQTGYLVRGNPGSPVVFAALNRNELIRIRNDYPLLTMLNPGAYSFRGGCA